MLQSRFRMLVCLGMMDRMPIGNLVNVGEHEGRIMIMRYLQRDEDHARPEYKLLPEQRVSPLMCI